jgi:hypothetical protein
MEKSVTGCTLHLILLRITWTGHEKKPLGSCGIEDNLTMDV